MFRYAITIFLSAFLLFQVQPMIGKVILPWFGGSPAVWTSCMLFFQVALLAGYSYAHFLTSNVPLRYQTMVHVGLLLLSLPVLAIILNLPGSTTWRPLDEANPVGRILLLLGATIGLPYFILSTTGPLMQEGYRRETGHPPYRLYALSNIGSLLALLTYPIVFEPFFKLKLQTTSWSIAYCVFAAFCGWCALGLSKAPHPSTATDAPTPAQQSHAGPPTLGTIVLWLALACCGSVMLLATTNQLCQEVTSIPFLWVVPLSLYLVTFIICFDAERWYVRNIFLLLLFVAVYGACYALWKGNGLGVWNQLLIYGGVLWVCCMVCHGELAGSKPAPRYATLFYLMVALGGAIGGVLIAVVAPNVLTAFWEYQIALVATLALAMFANMRPDAAGQRDPNRMAAAGVLAMAAIATTGWLIYSARDRGDGSKVVLEQTRNFYGIVRIHDDLNDNSRALTHGATTHGWQFQDDERRRIPTAYFGPHTGVGLAMLHHPKHEAGKPVRIGIIGLGCGSLAVYANAGDTLRYYEIDPQVIIAANKWFTYLKDAEDAGVHVDTVLGDARIKMEQQVTNNDVQPYDILIIDAFSSDAIPMHLLTKEFALTVKEHLKEDGILVIHISNRWLDLSGVVRGVAQVLDLECHVIAAGGDDEHPYFASTWVVLTNNQDFLDNWDVQDGFEQAEIVQDDPAVIVWTDDYSNLYETVDWQ